MRTSIRLSTIHIAASAFALSCVAACGSSNKPEPESANEASSASTSEPQNEEEALAAAVGALKSQIQGLVCNPESFFRACLRIPDDAACSAAYDEVFPGCSPDFTAEGDDEYWTRVGQEMMTCIAGGFTAKFPAVDTPEGAQRCAAATEAAKQGG